LDMLRYQLGDDGFYRGLKRYLEVNRGKNVVTADLAKAIEESSHVNVDQFFSQWLYGAGAPKFDLGYSYDHDKHQVELTVKQTQKVEGRVGIFHVPVNVEITTASGPRLYPITVSKAEQVFTLPSDSAPLMVLSVEITTASGPRLYPITVSKAEQVFTLPSDSAPLMLLSVEITTASGPRLYPITVSKAEQVFTLPSDSAPLTVLFDKANRVLKSTEFHKEKKEWLYQLKNAGEFADRADAVSALEKIKNDDEVVSALGNALRNDKFWGLRATAADALGQIGSPAASKQLLDALDSANEPWVRYRIVAALGNFKDDSAIPAKLTEIAKADSSYRASAAALQALGRLKTPDALATLGAAVS